MATGLHLLSSTAQRMVTDARLLSVAEYRRRYGASAIGYQTWADVQQARVDQPQTGQVAIASPDERERKYGKPQVLADFNGRRPLFIFGGGQDHLGDMVDLANEVRHYGEDEPEHVTKRERPDFKALLTDYDDQTARRRAGRKTYGKSTT